MSFYAEHLGEGYCEETRVLNFRVTYCSQKATVDGKWCGKHDPKALQQTSEKQIARYKERLAGKQSEQELHALGQEALRFLPRMRQVLSLPHPPHTCYTYMVEASPVAKDLDALLQRLAAIEGVKHE